MVDMEWTRKAGLWVPTAPSQLPSHEQKGPGNSKHLAWSQAGQLRVVSLKDGDILTRTHDSYLLDGILLQSACVAPATFPANAGLQFRVERNGIVARFGADADWLQKLAEAVQAEKIVLTAQGSILEFAYAAGQWEARSRIKPHQLPAQLALNSLVDATLRIEIRWEWAARWTGCFTINGNNRAYWPEAARNRDWEVGLIFDSLAPEGLGFRQWRLEPSTAPGEELHAVLKSSGDGVTLRQFVNAIRLGPAFSGTGYKAEVSVACRVDAGESYYALCRSNNSIEPSVENESSAWSYGPPVPFYPGGADGTRLSVKKVAGNGNVVTAFRNAELAAGRLPAPFSEKGLLLLVPPAQGTQAVCGVLTLASDVPQGKWLPAAGLGSADTVICWRGLIDRATLDTVTVDNATHAFLKLANGFALKDEMWIVAPFAGVAMTKTAGWWGDLDHPEFQVCRSRNTWVVQGRWLRLDLEQRTGIIRNAMHLTKPAAIVFHPGQDAVSASGPVLEIAPDRLYPVLRGWLADSAGCVRIQGAVVALSGKGESLYTLADGASPESTDFPEHIKAALRAAMDDPNAPGGTHNGVPWRRRDDQIEISATSTSGVYALRTVTA